MYAEETARDSMPVLMKCRKRRKCFEFNMVPSVCALMRDKSALTTTYECQNCQMELVAHQDFATMNSDFSIPLPDYYLYKL